MFRPRRLPTWQNMILRSWRSTWRMMAHVHNTPGRQSLEKVKPNEELEAARKSEEKISKTRFAFTDDWWDYVCFALVFCCIFVFCQVIYTTCRCLFALSMEAFMKLNSWFWGEKSDVSNLNFCPVCLRSKGHFMNRGCLL